MGHPDVDRELRDFKRYTGDGLSPPVDNAPLPTGLPTSGLHNVTSRGMRTALNVVLDEVAGAQAAAEAAAASADTAAGLIVDAVAQGNVPIYSTAAIIPTLEIPEHLNAFRTNGKVTSGDGLGRLYREVVSQPAHDGWVQDSESRYFELIPDNGYDCVRLRDYLDRYTSPRAALIEAFKATFNGATTNPAVLECEGIEILTPLPVAVTVAEIATGAGFRRNRKTVRGLNLRLDTGGTWAPGDALFYVAGNQTLGNLRDVEFVNCRFDAADQAGVTPFRCSGYYHMRMQSCVVTRFAGVGVHSSKLESDGTGNHGFSALDCVVQGTFGENAGKTAYLLEDGDAVVRGGHVDWVETGIRSTRGGVKVEQVHFSMADGTSAMRYAVHCTAPRGIDIVDNDFDGCGVMFTNAEPNDFVEGAYHGWRNLSIRGNDFGLASKDPPAGRGVINFVTETAGNSVANLTVAGNRASDPLTAQSLLRFSGSGSWTTDWECVVSHAKASNIDVGTVPGIVRVVETTQFGLTLRTGAGAILRSAGGGSTFLQFHDSTNAGSDMPGIASSGQSMRVRSLGGSWQAELHNNGTWRPTQDNLQQLGGPSNRWTQLYATSGSINTSDARLKEWRGDLTDAEIRVASRLAREVGIYRWLDAIAAKGEGARLHAGWIAQRVVAAFVDEGLDAFAYGLLCWDAWEAAPEEREPDGRVTVPARAAGDRYSLRETELLAFIAAGFEARLARLEAMHG